jgi:hypothetical protein
MLQLVDFIVGAWVYMVGEAEQRAATLFCTLSLSLSLSLSLFGLILISVPHEPQDFVAVKCGGRSRGQRGTEERRLSGYALTQSLPQSLPHSLSLLTHSLMHSLTHSLTYTLLCCHDSQSAPTHVPWCPLRTRVASLATKEASRTQTSATTR